jgi:hypothetical protein
VQFPERANDIGEEHHAEARCTEIKRVVGKWQSLRISLQDGDLRESALAGPMGGDFEELRAEI